MSPFQQKAVPLLYNQLMEMMPHLHPRSAVTPRRPPQIKKSPMQLRMPKMRESLEELNLVWLPPQLHGSQQATYLPVLAMPFKVLLV
jgi:hypothetical protein